MKQSRAERLGLDSVELAVLDSAARNFESSANVLRDEAFRCHDGLARSGQNADPVRVRSFTDRRASLARDAESSMRSTMTPLKYMAFAPYITKLTENARTWK